jgi:hypothetical protein
MAAMRLAGVFVAFSLVTWCQVTNAEPPSAKPEASLLPFSTPLLSRHSAIEERLARLIADMDAVERAWVVLRYDNQGPHVLVTVRWRGRQKSPQSLVPLIRNTALAFVDGLSETRLVIADTRGRVWFENGRATAAGLRDETGQPRRCQSLWLALLCLFVVAGGTAALMFTRRKRTLAWPEAVAGMSPREVSRLLSFASPAVRGAVLSGMPQAFRRSVEARLRGDIEWPQRAAASDFVTLALAALAECANEEGQP